MFDIWHLKKLHGYCVEQVMTVVILGKNSVPGSGCKLHGYSVATVLQWFQSMIQSLVIKTISPFYLVLWALDFSGNSNTVVLPVLTPQLHWVQVIFSVILSARCNSSGDHLNVSDRYAGHARCLELSNHQTHFWVLPSFPKSGQPPALPLATAPSHSFVCRSLGPFGLLSF